MNKSSSLAIGRVAGITVAILTSVFAISLIWELVVLSEFAKNLGYLSSMLIAFSAVILMACFCDTVKASNSILGLLALVFAIIYATFCTSIYFLQLSVVAFNPLSLTEEVMKAIRFVPGSPTFAIDMLGYGFLCLSTLVVGFALRDPKGKVLKILCIFHGVIAIPTFAAPIISGIFRSTSGQTNDVGNYVLLFWCIVFVPIALLFVRYFNKSITE